MLGSDVLHETHAQSYFSSNRILGRPTGFHPNLRNAKTGIRSVHSGSAIRTLGRSIRKGH